MTQSTTIWPVPARASRQYAPQQSQEPIGKWVPVGLIAETSLCRIYRACSGKQADRPAGYVLKVLRKNREDDAGALAVMCREAQAARAVRHPRVISVLAAGLHTPPYYIVTPWLPGRTLAERLAADEPLDLPVVLWIVRQVAEALDGLAAAGWMHGDVKPENLMISPEGRATLLDLGFARRLDPSPTGENNHAKAALDWRYFTGTGSYLAPEAAGSGVAADIRSDIYSLGVMFYELLTGRLPFADGDLADILTRHREAAVPNLRRFAPHVPLEVTQLVRQMLSKQPLRRPGSPRELVERLSELEILVFDLRTPCGGLT